MRKSFFGAFDQVRHELGCTATKDGQRLKISNIRSRGILYIYVYSEDKCADQLQGDSAADLRLCFQIRKKQVFLMMQINYYQ